MKRSVLIGLVLGILLVLAVASLPGCTFLNAHLVRIDGAGEQADGTIVVPEGGYFTLSPDGVVLTVYDRFGAVVWQGDPR
jgi:hypothetical protein